MEKDKVKAIVRNETMNMMESVLNYVQVAVPESNWKAIRSKILRAGNDCIRKIHKEIDR